MRGWLIFGIVLLCLWLVGRLRLGAAVRYGQELAVDLRIGPFQAHILPTPPEKTGKPPKAKKPKKEKPPKTEPAAPKQKKWGVSDIVSLVLDLIPVAVEALGKLRRKLCIERLYVDWMGAGAEDAAKAAILCGRLQTAVGTMLPALETAADLRSYRIRLDVDYNADKMALTADAAASFTLGQLVCIALWLAVKGFVIFIKHNGQVKQKAGKNNGKQAAADQ